MCWYIKKKSIHQIPKICRWNTFRRIWDDLCEFFYSLILVRKSNIQWYFPRRIIALHKNDRPSSCLPGFDPTCNLATSRCQVRNDEHIAHRTWTRADGSSARSHASDVYYGQICTGPVEGEAATRDTWPSPGSYPPMKLPRSLVPSGAWSVSRSPPHI